MEIRADLKRLVTAAVAHALLCLAKMKPVSDGQRRRGLATAKGSDHVEG